MSLEDAFNDVTTDDVNRVYKDLYIGDAKTYTGQTAASSGTLPSIGSITTNGAMWTNTTSPYQILSTTDTISTANWNFPSQHKDLHVTGEFVINGRNINDIITSIEERLAILTVNEELESRWDELKQLAIQYKKLEKEIIEKEKMWKILNK